MIFPKVQINPASRTATVFHTLYILLLPVVVITLIGLGFPVVAYMAILLSKWRMLAVKPRYWLANIRANMVDIIVGFSVVGFMTGSGRLVPMLFWASLHALWLVFLKPRSDNASIAGQAFVAQGLGLISLYDNASRSNPLVLIVFTWLICFTAARHLLVMFEDSANRVMSHVWALFGAQLGLILGYWQISYRLNLGVFSLIMPQIALVISLIGYALGLGYYIHKTHGLRSGLKTQLTVFCIVIISLIIVLSDWQATTF